jgi:hypothetical protein
MFLLRMVVTRGEAMALMDTLEDGPLFQGILREETPSKLAL